MFSCKPRSQNAAQNESADDECHQPSVRLRHAASVSLRRDAENSTELKIKLDLVMTKSTRGIAAPSTLTVPTRGPRRAAAVVVFL